MAYCLVSLPLCILDFIFLLTKSARISKYSCESDILPDNYSLKRFTHLGKIQSVDLVGKNLPTLNKTEIGWEKCGQV